MKRILATMVALTMVAAMFVPIVGAQDVTIQASVSSQGNPPVIEYTFVLSDTGDPTHVTQGTQILPNPGSGINEVLTPFKKYAVVSDPNGIADIAAVYEQLYNPDESPHTAEVLTTDITGTQEQTDALNEALNSGLITQAEFDDIKYKLDPNKKQARLFRVDNSLTNHDKPGAYKVHFKAVDNGGAIGEADVFFDYLSLKALELDFSTIDYGAIVVNTQKVVSGDEQWATTPNKPTVKNQGNVQFEIQASASDLIGQNLPSQKIPASALSVHLLVADLPQLSNTPKTLAGAFLQPCTPTQIDFDITAPLGTSANTYTGTLTLAIA